MEYGMAKMTVAQKKDFARAQKIHLIHVILTYQEHNEFRPEDLQGKTLKQLEAICTKLGI